MEYSFNRDFNVYLNSMAVGSGSGSGLYSAAAAKKNGFEPTYITNSIRIGCNAGFDNDTARKIIKASGDDDLNDVLIITREQIMRLLRRVNKKAKEDEKCLSQLRDQAFKLTIAFDKRITANNINCKVRWELKPEFKKQGWEYGPLQDVDPKTMLDVTARISLSLGWVGDNAALQRIMLFHAFADMCTIIEIGAEKALKAKTDYQGEWDVLVEGHPMYRFFQTGPTRTEDLTKNGKSDEYQTKFDFWFGRILKEDKKSGREIYIPPYQQLIKDFFYGMCGIECQNTGSGGTDCETPTSDEDNVSSDIEDADMSEADSFLSERPEALTNTPEDVAATVLEINSAFGELKEKIGKLTQMFMPGNAGY